MNPHILQRLMIIISMLYQFNKAYKMRKDFDIDTYHSHFQKNVSSIQTGPIDDQNRTINDKCCVVTFFVLMILTLVFGIIMISQGKLQFDADHHAQGIQVVGAAFNKFAGLIVGMLILSLFLSIIFLLLIKNFPKCMVWSMIVLIIVVFIGLAILGFANQNYWLAIMSIILILIVALIIFCCRQKIKVGIQLLKAATDFLSEKPQAFTTPLYSLFAGILFFIFWAIAIVALVYTIQDKQRRDEGTGKQTFFAIYYIFIMVFMQAFLYYISTFILATACAYWYYDLKQNYCQSALKRIHRYHIGSLTFGALVIAIINILKRAAKQGAIQGQRQGNAIAACCLCILGCCLSFIQGLLEVLNQNSVIVMAVTGESYIGSAKSALSIIFQNFPLFYVVDFIGGLVQFFGVLLSAGIPTFLGFIIAQYGFEGSQVSQIIGVTVVIFFISIFLTSVLIGLISEALACVFIFYCFDRKFIGLGINIANAPETIRNLLNYSQQGGQYYSGQGHSQAHFKNNSK